MLLILLLGVISSIYSFPLSEGPGGQLDSKGVLYLERISSPLDYTDLIKEKGFQEIQICTTAFTEEIIGDLTERIDSWPSLHSISVLSCTFPGDSARAFAKVLTSHPQINEVRIVKSGKHFFSAFLEELTMNEPYLKKLEIRFNCHDEDGPVISQPAKLEKVLSRVEHASAVFYHVISDSFPGGRFRRRERGFQLFATLIASMQNVKHLKLES